MLENAKWIANPVDNDGECPIFKKEFNIDKEINLSRKTTCTYNTNLFICKNIDRFHNYYIIPLNLSHKTKK